MLEAGSAAPDFEAETSLGRVVRLSSLRGHPVVLFFYPRADTPGCTIETKAFRDLHGALTAKGVEVLGISVDTVADQSSFSEKCSVPFPLVADPTKAITRSYGVLGLGGTARRVTFFIGPDGKIAETLDSGRPGPHIDRAKALYLAGS